MVTDLDRCPHMCTLLNERSWRHPGHHCGPASVNIAGVTCQLVRDGGATRAQWRVAPS